MQLIFKRHFLYALILLSCYNHKNKDVNAITFRLLPCDQLRQHPDKKPDLLRLYAVETNKGTADTDLVARIDSFVCTQINSVIFANQYSNLVMEFLKESDLTKKLVSNEVTDSHNPYGSDHYCLAKYFWMNSVYQFRTINNDQLIDGKKIKCVE